MIEMVHAPREAQTKRTRLVLASDTAAAVEIQSTTTTEQIDRADESTQNEQYISQHIAYRISQTQGDLKSLFDSTYQALQALGDDVQVREQKFYVAFKRIKNFACLEVYPQRGVVLVHVKVDPDTITLEPGFSRDVRAVGHFGTGDLQLSLRNTNDLQKAQPLFVRSYEGS